MEKLNQRRKIETHKLCDYCNCYLYSLHLKSMFAGRVSCLQGCPSEANYTADSHNAPSALLRHVRQHLLGDGDRAKEVELHQGLIHINTGLHEQGALASATIVN